MRNKHHSGWEWPPRKLCSQPPVFRKLAAWDQLQYRADATNCWATAVPVVDTTVDSSSSSKSNSPLRLEYRWTDFPASDISSPPTKPKRVFLRHSKKIDSFYSRKKQTIPISSSFFWERCIVTKINKGWMLICNRK